MNVLVSYRRVVNMVLVFVTSTSWAMHFVGRYCLITASSQVWPSSLLRFIGLYYGHLAPVNIWSISLDHFCTIMLEGLKRVLRGWILLTWDPWSSAVSFKQSGGVSYRQFFWCLRVCALSGIYVLVVVARSHCLLSPHCQYVIIVILDCGRVITLAFQVSHRDVVVVTLVSSRCFWYTDVVSSLISCRQRLCYYKRLYLYYESEG